MSLTTNHSLPKKMCNQGGPFPGGREIWEAIQCNFNEPRTGKVSRSTGQCGNIGNNHVVNRLTRDQEVDEVDEEVTGEESVSDIKITARWTISTSGFLL